MLRNLKQIIKAYLILAATTLSATTTTIAQDLQGLKSFAFEIAFGAFVFDGVNFLTAKIVESDDNITFTDVVASQYYENDVLVFNDTAHQNAVHLLQYRGYKRYVKLVLTETGTVSVPVAINGLSECPEFQPKA
jgi:hypothetical protein